MSRKPVLAICTVVMVWWLGVRPVAATCDPGDEDPWLPTSAEPTTLTGAGRVVAVIDAPVVADHPVWESGPGQVINASDQASNVPATPQDVIGYPQDHGTVVASVVHQTAPGADVVVYSPGSFGFFTTAFEDPLSLQWAAEDVAGAINNAVVDDVDVIVMAQTLSARSDQRADGDDERRAALDPVEQAIRRALNNGILVIVGSGTTGTGPDCQPEPEGDPRFPGGVPGVFIVGGVEPVAVDGGDPIWDPYPCLLDGPFVDAYAPAVGVRAADIDGASTEASGAGVTAPVFAGIAALLLERHPQIGPGLLRELLVAVSSSNEGQPIDNSFFAAGGVPDFGRVQLAADFIAADTRVWVALDQHTPRDLSGIGSGFCFALDAPDGWLDLNFEINRYRSTEQILWVRGLVYQFSRGPLPDDQRPSGLSGSGTSVASLTTPDGADLTVETSAVDTGCERLVDDLSATEWRHYFPLIRVPREAQGAGWCRSGPGTYTLEVDMGDAGGTQSRTFEVSEADLDGICCGTQTGLAAGSADDPVDPDEGSGSGWTWWLGGLVALGAIAAAAALAALVRSRVRRPAEQADGPVDASTGPS